MGESPRTTYRFNVIVEVVVDLPGEDDDETYSQAHQLVKNVQQIWSSDDPRVTLGISTDVPEPFEMTERTVA